MDGAADLLVEQDRARSGGRCRSSCRSRARPAGARPGRCRASPAGSPRRARRARRRRAPSRNSSSTPSTSTPRGLDGIVKRIAALGRVLVRPGEDLARRHVALAVGVDPRAAVDAQRAGRCPSASMRSSRAPAQALDQPRLEARAARPTPPTGSSRSRNSARATKPRTRAVPMPACCARGRRRPQRRRTSAAAARASRTGAARGPRGPCAPGRRRPARVVLSGAWMRERGVDRLGLGQLGGREGVEVARRARAPSRPRPAPGSAARSSGHASRSSISRWSASSSGAASVVERTTHLLAGLHVEAVAGQQPREGGGVRPVTAPRGRGSARRGARAGRRGSSAARRREAKRKRASSSFWRSIGSVPAISQRTASRSNRNSTARCQASSAAEARRPRTVGVLARAWPASSRRAARARRPRRPRRRVSGAASCSRAAAAAALAHA